MSDPIDARISRLADRQQGNATREQLLGLGLGGNAIDRRIARGSLFPRYPGVYGVGRRATTPLERASAAVLACGPDALLSHTSAMTLWGWLKRWEKPFHVTLPKGDRRPHGIIVHRSRTLTKRDITRQHRIRVTSPARSLIDGLPSLRSRTRTRVVNDALRSPYLHLAELSDALERHPTHPGTRLVKVILDRPGGPTRSEFEDLFVGFCERYDLPTPTTAQQIAGHETDALFPTERVIVELDGHDFHNDRHAFESDRDRDADTLAAGYPTVRITWQRLLYTPSREAARLHAILAQRRAA